MLHEKIRGGECVVRDGAFPPSAHSLFRSFGPSKDLFEQAGEARGKLVTGEGLLDWGEGATKRPAAKKKGEPAPKLRASTWRRECTEEECRLCGVRRIQPDSSRWGGTGIFAYLSAADGGDTRDPPGLGTGVGHFGMVPAPPAKWQDFRFKQPHLLLNTRAGRDKAEAAAGKGGGADGGEGDGEEEAAAMSDSDYEFKELEDATAGETDELESDDQLDELNKGMDDGGYRYLPHLGHYGYKSGASLLGARRSEKLRTLRQIYQEDPPTTDPEDYDDEEDGYGHGWNRHGVYGHGLGHGPYDGEGKRYAWRRKSGGDEDDDDDEASTDEEDWGEADAEMVDAGAEADAEDEGEEDGEGGEEDAEALAEAGALTEYTVFVEDLAGEPEDDTRDPNDEFYKAPAQPARGSEGGRAAPGPSRGSQARRR